MDDIEIFSLNLYTHYGLNPTPSELSNFIVRFDMMLQCVLLAELGERMAVSDVEKYIGFLDQGAPEKAEAFVISRGLDPTSIMYNAVAEAKRRVLDQNPSFGSVEELHASLKFALPPSAAAVVLGIREQCKLKFAKHVADRQYSSSAFTEAQLEKVIDDSLYNLVEALADEEMSPEEIPAFMAKFRATDLVELATALWTGNTDVSEMLEHATDICIERLDRRLATG